jgi:predicted ester cyclase
VANAASEALVREYMRLVDAGEFAAAAGLFADDAINHGMTVDRGTIELVLRSLGQALPDQTTEIVEMASDGEVVTCRTSVTGTHLGTPDLPFVEGGVFAVGPPTGRAVTTTRMHWLRIRDGKIVEHWANRDDLGLARQLGILDGSPMAP